MAESLQLEISGLDLCRDFYWQVGRPLLEQRLPHCLPRLAAGLVGEGSECFGFDDRISLDHDYGPSFCLWLNEEDFQQMGDELRRVLEELPQEFRGVKYALRLEQARGRRGIATVNGFYRRFLGPKGEPETLVDWFLLPETHLAAATNGRVFEDNLGEFSRIRQKLLSFYPQDVLLHRLASRALTMAHEGQCNYSRMMRRGDRVAACLALSSFIRAACSMIFLLNRGYAPYDKWLWRGVCRLALLGEAAPILAGLAEGGPNVQYWPAEKWQEYESRLNQADPVVEGVERICQMVGEELRRQGLCESRADYLEEQARELQAGIEDDLIRRQPLKVN